MALKRTVRKLEREHLQAGRAQAVNIRSTITKLRDEIEVLDQALHLVVDYFNSHHHDSTSQKVQ